MRRKTLPMSKVTNFPRLALKRQAFVVVLLFGLSSCLIFTAIHLGGALIDATPFRSPLQIGLCWAVVIGVILLKAYRGSTVEFRSWIMLRILWRRQRWVALFGFPFALMLFCIGVSFFFSASHWFSNPPGQAAQYSLAYAAIFGLLGFYSGFALHLQGGALEYAEAARVSIQEVPKQIRPL